MVHPEVIVKAPCSSTRLAKPAKKVKGVEKAKFRSGHKLTTADLEDALFQWVSTACANKITLDNDIIQVKARQLAEEKPEWAFSD